jgi:hypothetical protein
LKHPAWYDLALSDPSKSFNRFPFAFLNPIIGNALTKHPRETTDIYI